MLVSVIIPTQSRTGMLRSSVSSVLRQTVQDFELIIVANAATPEHLAVVREMEAEHSNIRVVVLPTGGLAKARNAGIKAARGEWVGFLDDDDVWFSTKLEKQLARANETGADLVSCQAIAVNDGGDIGMLKYERPSDLPLRKAMTIYNWLPGSASGALVRRQVLLGLGCFDGRLPASEDWDMWRRIAWNHHMEILSEPLIRYRIHDQSMSLNRRLMVRAELMVLWKAIFDSPIDLKPLVLRAWRAFAMRQGYHLYGTLNARTYGIPFRVVRLVRRLIGRPRAA